MVKVIARAGERLITADVDRKRLAVDLFTASLVAKFNKVRPGQPINLTQTPSDPISYERAATLHTMADAILKKRSL